MPRLLRLPPAVYARTHCSARVRAFRRLLGAVLALSLLIAPSAHADPAPTPAGGGDAPVPAPTSRPVVALLVEGSPRPGGVLFVTVHRLAVSDASLELSWLGRRYPVVSDRGRWRAILPVPVDTKPGSWTVSLLPSEGPALATRTVTVQRVTFPHQSIRLPPAMLATYDQPRNKADDQLHLDAARVFTPIRFWHGPFLQPASGPQSTGFGQQRLYNGWRKGWHKGQDIEAASGSPIRAANAGVVVVVAPNQIANGNATLINHGMGVYSLYMHQSRIRVQKGQNVSRGELIGNVGSTGAGTGPHLHWQCYVHGVFVDPQALMHAPADW